MVTPFLDGRCFVDDASRTRRQTVINGIYFQIVLSMSLVPVEFYSCLSDTKADIPNDIQAGTEVSQPRLTGLKQLAVYQHEKL